MADIYELLWTMGLPATDLTDLTQVEPFRISTVGERLMLRKAMEDSFNLPEGGYVENPWGFPPMPLPVRREAMTTGQMIAPDTISFEGLGHPIFWIDPALTRRTPEEREHPARWNVRMFFLIMSLGMYDHDSLRWYNVPRSQGIDYTEQDWLAYKQGTSSVLDMVRPLGESDLIEPLESVRRQSEYALARCAEAQTKVWAEYRAELDSAYTTAVATTQGRSEWDALDKRIKTTTSQIAIAVEQGYVPSSLVPDVYREVDELERIVTHTERCALLLSIPVLRTTDQGDRAAIAATALNTLKADIDISIDELRTEAHRLFELSGKSSPADFVRLHEDATRIYMTSWRALMVAARNLVRTAEGNSIYRSWDQFVLVEDPHATSWPPLGQVLAGAGR